jgi:tRNA pseudouridine13 synthase
MHLPKHVSWKILRYTDPEVPLAQSDEDTILGLEPAMPQSDGKFVALQIELQLGSAVYATMALREITKTETSSHFQTTLTQATEDQAEKGSSGAKRSDEEVINPNDE